MTESGILNEVTDTVRSAAKIAPGVKIAPETRLIEDLSIDSLDLVGVFLQIQDRFDLAIDDDDVPRLRRIVDVADYVARRRTSAAA